MQNTLLNKQVKDNMTTVNTISYKYSVLYNLCYDDCKQVASIGLLKALNTFNGNGSIKGHIARYVKSEIMHFMRDKNSLIKIGNRVLTKEQQSNISNISSLDAPIDENSSLIDTLMDTKINNNDIEHDMLKCLNLLNNDERKVIILLYYYGYKNIEVAKIMKYNEMRVSRIHKQALQKLHDMLK